MLSGSGSRDVQTAGKSASRSAGIAARAGRGDSAPTIASRALKKPATDCEPCAGAAAASGRVRGRAGKKAPPPCHPPDYVDPTVRRDLNAALRDLKRIGITPKITSAWRSSGDQGRMYRCSSSRRCRIAHPGLFKAMPPGESAHEAGFAVDIAGVASGPRGRKRLTPQGRRIVQVMETHGFEWKYGLADPVHFEADPREHGYRTLKQAIHVTQTRCQARILARAAVHSSAPQKPAIPVRLEHHSSRVAPHRRA